MSVEQNLCEVKIFQLQFMLNEIRCIDQRFAFKNSSISCLASIFNLSHLRMTNSVESRPGPGLSFSLLYFIYGAGLQPRLRAISLLTTRCASARLPLPLVLPPIA